MKERPIMFSGPMVLALLADTKTQTRRVIKPQPPEYGDPSYGLRNDWRCPFGVDGDRLWVRETWAAYDKQAINQREREGIFYRADNPKQYDSDGPWKSSLFMPRWASRITLEVTGVRVERLQQISEADAIAEGIEPNWIGPLDKGPNGTGTEGWLGDSWRHYLNSVDGEPAYTPVESYRSLWDSINGKRAPWASNPWVWVIAFRRIAPATA